MLRAVAAVEVNDEVPGLEATQVLRTIGVLDATTESAVNVAAALNIRGWLNLVTNSLGMRFAPVPGTKVLFSIWETRVQDYEAFAKATGRSWEKPDFSQGATHPAVNVSWNDATAFCEWLTREERKTGRIKEEQSYRLPTDREWSAAVGLKEESGSTPEERAEKIAGMYPWGKEWPPPKGSGNYESSLKTDEYEQTAPVGSFAANDNGIYDLGGNVWEWCEDRYGADSDFRVLRGASWGNYGDPVSLLSSSRGVNAPGDRYDSYGFRCVLAVESSR